MKRSDRTNRRPAPRPRDRRGVLLLVVLSMLVLFLLVGATFLITSGQYRTASQVVEKATRTTFQPADVLERALMQLLRDTNSPSSVIRYHSLLRDLYGADGFAGRVLVNAADVLGEGQGGTLGLSGTSIDAIAPRYAGVDPVTAVGATAVEQLGPTGGAVVEFYVADVEDRSAGTAARLSDNNAVGLDFDASGLPIEHQLPPVDGYYNGCLLTMMSGPCRGSSVRVLDYDHVYTTVDPGANAASTVDDVIEAVAKFRVMTPSRVDGASLSTGPLPSVPSVSNQQLALTDFVESATLGHRFIVNGRPFNGTGVGFNALALSHDAVQSAPSPRLSAVEVDPAFPANYGMEVALAPNAVHFLNETVAHLTPTQGQPIDPFPAATAGNVTNVFRALNVAGSTPLYERFAGPGDTDESYDAPDTQNMALAMQAPEPRLRGRVVNAAGASLDPAGYYPASGIAPPPAYLDLDGVTIPSFHRPALANFWFHRLHRSAWLAGVVIDPNERARAILQPYNASGIPQFGLDVPTAAQIAAIKRKFMLRPLREDHPDFDGSNPLSRYGVEPLATAFAGGNLVNPNTSEITFPHWEAVGPWDVDNDGDGVPDSIWVDVGLPVQKTEDGRWYKPLVAMLVEDLDGRLNLNAHGSTDDLVRIDPSQSLDVSQIIDRPNSPFPAFQGGNLAQDFLAGLPLNSSDQLPTGEGWGPAEVSIRSILSPSLPLAELTGPPSGAVLQGNPQYDDYARLLLGRPDPALDSRTVGARPWLLNNRIPEALATSESFGRYGSQPGNAVLGEIGGAAINGDLILGAANGIAGQFNGIRQPAPGISFVPFAGYQVYGVDQQVRARTQDQRTQQESLGTPGFEVVATEAALPRDVPSGYGTPPDWRGRYAGGLSAAGAPVGEAKSSASLLTEQAIFQNANTGGVANANTALGPFSHANPRFTWRQDLQNTPIDSPYEINLSSESRRLPPVSIDAIRRSYTADGDLQVDAAAAPLDDDAPFSAAELERILRASDADAEGLPDRLWNLVDAFDPVKLAAATKLEDEARTGLSSPITSLDNLVAAARASINRRSVTTDSWDLPVPNENWSERLTLGADGLPGVPWNDGDLINGIDPDGVRDATDVGDDDGDGLYDEGDEAVVGYNHNPDPAQQFHTFGGGSQQLYNDLFNAGCDDYVVVMREDPPASPRVTDYLRYRVTLRLLRLGSITFDDLVNPGNRRRVEKLVEEILFGSDLRANTLVRTRSAASNVDDTEVAGVDMTTVDQVLMSYGGLLAPEVLAGRRMDLNRPLGDGRDNNGNGVVDEPAEAGRPYLFDLNELQTNQVIKVAERNNARLYLDANHPSYADTDINNDVYTQQDLDDDGVLYVDSDGDGQPDRFDPGDLADFDGDGVFEPVIDNLWLDDNGDDVRDPTDGNGVRDAGEFAPFAHTPAADVNGRGVFVETNTGQALDPTYNSTDFGVRDDGPLARQLLARHLYCLMLTLMDENYLAPYDPNDLQVQRYIDPDITDGFAHALFKELDGTDRMDPGPPPEWYTLGAQAHGLTGDPKTDARRIAMRKLTCRKVAQWAVNVVDFRDPDAIQTAFEYDEYPWDGWNVVDTAGTIATDDDTVYPLDSDLTTDETARFVRDLGDTPFVAKELPTGLPAIRSTDQTRGVVWGAERPEVLLTEGLAWHDRRLVDAEIDIAGDGAFDDPTTSDLGLITGDSGNNPEADDDLDQIIRPKGHAYLEALNPWFDGLQQPAELYSSFVNNGVVVPGTNGIRFDRLSDVVYDQNGNQPVRSPIWRVICVEEDSRIRNATQRDLPTVQEFQMSDDDSDPLVPTNGWPFKLAPGVLPLFDAAQPYGQALAERDARHVAAMQTTDVNIVTGVQDADGLAISVGARETPLTVPDPAFPLFDRAVTPTQRSPNVPNNIAITSRIDANKTGQVNRLVFNKPLRYIERFAYMATPEPAGSVPFPDYYVPTGIVPVSDPSGFRIPNNRIQVTLGGANSWPTTDPWRFGADPSATTGSTSSFGVSTNRFGAFDWFDLDGDGDRLDPVALAPLLPGRRAVIGTQGNVYEIYSAPAGERAKFYSTDSSDPLGPQVLTERFTTVFTDPLPAGVNVSSGLGSSRMTLFGRVEMIPSDDPNTQQFGMRMNGLTESVTAYHAGADEWRNQTVSAAFPLASERGAEPVIVAPIDNFSISEPLDQYLLRIIELSPPGATPISFKRFDTYNSRSNQSDVYRLAEGIFEWSSGGAAGQTPLGFDEPFDILPELINNQTTPNYRSVHLERLANPRLPWNPEPYIWRPQVTSSGGLNPSSSSSSSSVTRVPNPDHNPDWPVNPYLPTDSLPMDLHAFNSQALEFDDPTNDPSGKNAPAFLGSATAPTSGAVNPPELLHKRSRPMPSYDMSFVPETSAPFAPVSKERDDPWGAFRSLWRASVGRLLWRQPKPTTTTELVFGTDQVVTSPTIPTSLKTPPQPNAGSPSAYRLGEVHVASDLEPRGSTPFDASGINGPSLNTPPGTVPPADTVVANGFNLLHELVQMDYGSGTSQLGNRIFQAGWRMSLGFGSPWMGKAFVGSRLRWRDQNSSLLGLANAEQVDLDGDTRANDLIGAADLFEQVADLFRDLNANGRPDELEQTASWDFYPPQDLSNPEDLDDGDGTVDAHEAAQNRLRDRSTTPALHWPNRPFASAGELLQVPAWGGSRMLTHYSAFNWLHTQGPEFWHHTQINPYNGEANVFHDGLDYQADGTVGTRGFNGNFADDQSIDNRDSDAFYDVRATNELRFRETLGHFGHLTNFFQTARFPAFVQQAQEIPLRTTTSLGSGGGPTTTPLPAVRTQVPLGASHFYRLLDYVCVPSPFTATETLLSQDVFGDIGLEPGDPRGGLMAPFNQVDRYREPGRVNLNTIVGRRDANEPPRIDPINGDTAGDDNYDIARGLPRVQDWWSEVYDGLMHRVQDDNLVDDISGAADDGVGDPSRLSGYDFYDENGTNGIDSLLAIGHLGPAWRDVALSRRGYVQPTFDPTVNPGSETIGLGSSAQNQIDYTPTRLHPDFPTFFANPFRAPGEGANVPLAHMVQTGVDATMLRAHPLSPGADGAWGRRGVDDRVVNKTERTTGDIYAADRNGIRDDAAEAGVLTLQLGGGGETVAFPTQTAVDRLSADVVLSRFVHSRGELAGLPAALHGKRGALPDTFLDDALRPNQAHFYNPRDVAPRDSATPGNLATPPAQYERVNEVIANTEIGRRVTPVPLFSGATIEPSLDTERNATTRFQPIQRMSSLATTRSNVYAVWITVGFFEVKQAQQEIPALTDDPSASPAIVGRYFNQDGTFKSDALRDLYFRVYPEGWTLGEELGFDDGTNRRHRGFYVVDRSRPVAFRPGDDANVSDAVLLRRRIE